jgi:hypothetical protein
MRAYPPASEETLRARRLLEDWAGEGFLSPEQYQRLKQETVSDLRTTNIFLRIVLFIFTLVGVGAAAGLFLVGFLSRTSDEPVGIFLVIFAVASYVAAEVVISRKRLYRYGIEEGLAMGSVICLCIGLNLLIDQPHSQIQSLAPAASAALALWVWHRFGLWYALPAAMGFAVFLPACWTSSHSEQHAILAALYAVGLALVIATRPRHQFDYVEESYSIAEAFLWLGIYLALNLQLSSLQMIAHWWGGYGTATPEFARPFYWTTWVFIWLLPPVVLLRGIRLRDRFVLVVGGVVAVLTFVSNKPYLGWPRHTWDPMLLGILLAGVALLLRRWLAQGEGGVRRGFTAARLSGKDKQWMNVGSAVLGW